VLVLCRHIRPLPSPRINLASSEQNNTLRHLAPYLYCPNRHNVCTPSMLRVQRPPPATREPP
jgi:hypothetical protein